MSVFYADRHGRLVAERVRVDAKGDVIEQALAIAGSSPPERGLHHAFPAAAFASASFDGVGVHGQFGVVLADRSFMGAQPGMNSAEARLAIRAAVCTAQVVGTKAPVMFYLNATPVTRLFGQPIRGGVVSNGHCPR